MTQDEFARRIGITQSHLSALERGDNKPGASVLLSISRAFDKSVDWLLTGEEIVAIDRSPAARKRWKDSRPSR